MDEYLEILKELLAELRVLRTDMDNNLKDLKKITSGMEELIDENNHD